ncbi:MAG: helix-turn-helix domain-containing protein [Alphaproteobacteria bacterium]|nr:helix-turn-helix domain-containing protein [Alphaproteobacteria bacterium]
MEIQDFVIKKLKLLIKHKYKNQLEFCKEFGINSPQLSRYMVGKTAISIDLLSRIADFSNIHISYFFIDESSPAAIDYDLLDEVISLVDQYAMDNNIKVGSKQYLTIYEAISNFKDNNKSIPTQEIFKLLKPTLETLKH